MPFLPKLIFAEAHLDPMTVKIMTKMASSLRLLGYKHFLDEKAEGTTAQGLLSEIAADNVLFEKLVTKLKEEYQLDIRQKEGLEHAFFRDERGMKLANFIRFHLVRLQYKTFIEQHLPQHKIDYVSIDLKQLADKNIPELVVLLLNPEREKQFAQRYFDSADCFGRVGYIHIEGLQKNILEKTSQKKAEDEYSFFAIHSGSHPDSQFLTKKFPLGMKIFDASKQAEDEIANTIVLEIFAKQKALMKRAQEESKMPQTENKNGFFAAKVSSDQVTTEKNLSPRV